MPATELLNMVGVESSTSAAAVSLDSDLDAFHRRIADSLIDLAAEEEGLMSLRWVRRLLDAFLGWQEEFGIVLFNHRAAAARAPVDRMVADHFERSLKALDVCNAIRDGTDRIRHWQRLLEIVLSALSGRHSSLSDGHLRRARKALVDLSVSMLDDKDSSSATALALAHRHRSFGRHSSSSSARHFRSLSSSVSRSWSAAKQLQAIAAPPAPRGAGEGLALAIQAANSGLLFTMWALVAAIPCQDRGGLHVHFPAAPRHLPWAGPMSALHDRIAEESRRRDRRNSCGLLREIRSAERCARAVTELVEEDRTSASSEEVRARVEELSELCSALREGLDPLERRVRDVFHRIVRSRTDGLDSLGRAFI